MDRLSVEEASFVDIRSLVSVQLMRIKATDAHTDR